MAFYDIIVMQFSRCLMKINLKIAGITVTYLYNYNNYLQDKIDQYRIADNDNTKYKLEVIISADIKKYSAVFRKVHNREYYFSNVLDVLCIFAPQDNTIIIQQTVFDKIENDIKIYLNSDFIDNLAAQEYILSGVMFLDIASREGCLPLHASAISFNNDALLFSAPSQTGKSTQTRLWKERFPDEIRYINDDKPLLYEKDDKIYVAGTPFSGSSVLNENIVKPLKALFFLEQGKQNKLIRLEKNEVLPLFMKNIMRPKEKEIWDKMFFVIEKIIDRIPIYLFFSTPDLSAVKAVYQELYFGGKR